MSMKYVRNMYGVPAKRGKLVGYKGRKGVITSSRGGRLCALIDGYKYPMAFHPWDLDYLDRNGTVEFAAKA